MTLDPRVSGQLLRLLEDPSLDVPIVNIEVAHQIALILNVDMWGAPDEDEELTHEDIDEATEAYLERVWENSPIDEPIVEKARRLGNIVMTSYVRNEIGVHEGALDANRLVEDIYERLDEEYGDPNGNFENDPSHEVEAAADALVAAIRRDYKSWQCEPAHRVEIDTLHWIGFHRPDWLEAP